MCPCPVDVAKGLSIEGELYDTMTLRLPPHSHCLECEDPIDEEESFCSEGCRLSYERKESVRKRKMMTFYIIVIILILAFSWISLVI